MVGLLSTPVKVLLTSIDVAIWPFDGELHDLLGHRDVVLVETYPKVFYGSRRRGPHNVEAFNTAVI